MEAILAPRGFFKYMQIRNLPQKIVNFLKEVKAELRKVSWPTRQETIRHTLTIIGFSLAVAAFLGGLDFLFSYLLNKFIL